MTIRNTLLDTSLSPSMIDRILHMIDYGYVVYERERSHVLLACDDCGECWSIRIPDIHSKLVDCVERNGCCITCGGRKVVLR